MRRVYIKKILRNFCCFLSVPAHAAFYAGKRRAKGQRLLNCSNLASPQPAISRTERQRETDRKKRRRRKTSPVYITLWFISEVSGFLVTAAKEKEFPSNSLLSRLRALPLTPHSITTSTTCRALFLFGVLKFQTWSFHLVRGFYCCLEKNPFYFFFRAFFFFFFSSNKYSVVSLDLIDPYSSNFLNLETPAQQLRSRYLLLVEPECRTVFS